jgi:hypothetical protein
VSNEIVLRYSGAMHLPDLIQDIRRTIERVEANGGLPDSIMMHPRFYRRLMWEGRHGGNAHQRRLTKRRRMRLHKALHDMRVRLELHNQADVDRIIVWEKAEPSIPKERYI